MRSARGGEYHINDGVRGSYGAKYAKTSILICVGLLGKALMLPFVVGTIARFEDLSGMVIDEWMVSIKRAELRASSGAAACRSRLV